jgi:hypothetical protein
VIDRAKAARPSDKAAARRGGLARRAGAVDTVVVEGASHCLPISNPDAVARVIEAASMSETFEAPNLDP